MAHTLDSINYTGTGFTIKYTLEQEVSAVVVRDDSTATLIATIRTNATAGTYTDTFSSASSCTAGKRYGLWTNPISSGGTSRFAIIGYYAGTAKTLTYNANGGSGEPSSQSSCWTSDKDLTLFEHVLSSTKPTRSGYTFLGWATSSTATTATYKPGAAVNTSATTLYAVWKSNGPTLRVKVNGAWKTATAVYVKVNGTWKAATAAYVKVSGAWKQST